VRIFILFIVGLRVAIKDWDVVGPSDFLRAAAYVLKAAIYLSSVE